MQPFYPTLAENVAKTVQNYTSRYGMSMLFEAAVGEPIPTTIHAKQNIKVYDARARRLAKTNIKPKSQ